MRQHVRLLIAAIVLTLSVATVEAYRYIAFEQLAVGASAVGFTPLKITPAGWPQAILGDCRLELGQIRFTIDGTVPTAAVGMLWEIGEERTFTGHDVLDQFRAIRTGATSGQLDCFYALP